MAGRLSHLAVLLGLTACPAHRRPVPADCPALELPRVVYAADCWTGVGVDGEPGSAYSPPLWLGSDGELHFESPDGPVAPCPCGGGR